MVVIDFPESNITILGLSIEKVPLFTPSARLYSSIQHFTMENLPCLRKNARKTALLWLICGLGMVQADVALSQVNCVYAIGLPSPTLESSPGGIPARIGTNLEYVLPVSTFEHPDGLPPDQYDRAMVWLDENAEVLNSKLLRRPTTEYMAWIDTAYQNKFVLAGTDDNDMTINLVTQDGTPVWNRKTGTANLVEKSVCVKSDDSGTLLLLGNQETSASQHSVVVVRVDGNGDQLWSKVFTLNGWTMEASSVAAMNCPDLQYYITGKMSPIGSNVSRVFLLVVNADGLPVQMNYYNIIQFNGSDAGTCVQVSCFPSPQIWISGYSYNPTASKYMVMMLKADALGNLDWGFNYDMENGDEFARHFIVRPSGELIVTGKAECHDIGSGVYAGYCMLTSIAPDGLSVNWLRSYRWSTSNLRWSQGYRVEKRPGMGEIGYFISGETELNGDKDILSILTQPDGKVSEFCYHDTTAQLVSNGTTAYPVDTANFDVKTLEYNESSILGMGSYNNNQLQCGEDVAVHELNDNEALPFRIYPNPATDKFSIVWMSDPPLKGQIMVSSVSGQTMRSLTLDGSNPTDMLLGQLPPGLYFVRIQSDDEWFKVAKLIIE